MRNSHPRYMCFPSVVCVGKETEVTVFPRDISRVFREGRHYELCIMSLGEDFISYHEPLTYDHPFTVENGVMKFTHTFALEHEYSIRIRDGINPDISVPLYAVEEDLFALRPLKGDLHSHTWYSDGQDGIPMTPADYREEGFDFFALTDHNRRYPSVLINELFADVPLGMHMMTGEEVHTPGSALHIVHVGGHKSVSEKYIHDIASYEAEVDAIEKTLTHIPEHYRRKAAMAKWACDSIHEAGGIAIFAHPFWKPRNYNVSDEFCRILFDMNIFDALELIGGTGSKSNNMHLALWQEQIMKGNLIPIVGSSDSHSHDFEAGGFGRLFSVVFSKENSTEAILEAIRGGLCVAGELPYASNSDVRFYGAQLRLVRYAHFLFENYFNETWRLCCGEGILMRRYAEGEPVEGILAALSGTVENHWKRFCGISPAPVIPPERMAFLEKSLQLQRSIGPETKGSLITPNGKNEKRE